MKVTSTCERQFVSNCIVKNQKRLDGRQLLDGRNLEIVFGSERGCCMVLLGNTRILAQVSCEVTEPKVSTPSEGILHVNLELSAMSAPEAKFLLRSSEEAVEAQRSLERCIRDSKCIDLESLCIVTGSKVWTLRVDIHALNDDGNLTECASIAAISALAHFRHPEVTAVGTDVIVHTLEEKEPKALRIRHMPISINLALFDQGKYILVDPTENEERIADGCYVIALNAHQEICFVHRRGVLLLKEDDVQRCEDVAVKRAQEVTQAIRNALDDDAYKRATKATIGFTNLIQTGTILGSKRAIAEFSLDAVQHEATNGEPEMVEKSIEVLDISENGEKTKKVVPSKAKRRALKLLKAVNMIQEQESAIFEGGPSQWGVEQGEEESDEETSSNEQEMAEGKPDVSSVKEEIDVDSEEETVYVDDDQVDMKPSTRGWYSKDPFM